MPKGIYRRTKKHWRLLKKARSFITKESREKLSKAHKGMKKPWVSKLMKGKKLSEETRRKMSKFHLGKHLSEETKKRISRAHRGKKKPWAGKYLRSEETKKKISKAMSKIRRGKKHSEETRRKISESHKGEKSYNWRGGVSSQDKRIRKGIEFRLWREAVFERDNYTCQVCGQKGGQLEPHHIFSFIGYPHLRFAINNGITLCIKCHRKTDNWGYKKRGKTLKEKLENEVK